MIKKISKSQYTRQVLEVTQIYFCNFGVIDEFGTFLFLRISFDVWDDEEKTRCHNQTDWSDHQERKLKSAKAEKQSSKGRS